MPCIRRSTRNCTTRRRWDWCVAAMFFYLSCFPVTLSPRTPACLTVCYNVMFGACGNVHELAVVERQILWYVIRWCVFMLWIAVCMSVDCRFHQIHNSFTWACFFVCLSGLWEGAWAADWHEARAGGCHATAWEGQSRQARPCCVAAQTTWRCEAHQHRHAQQTAGLHVTLFCVIGVWNGLSPDSVDFSTLVKYMCCINSLSFSAYFEFKWLDL